MLLGANTIGTKSPVWCSTEILQLRPNYRKSLSLIHDVFVNCFVRLQPCCNDHRFRSTTPTLVCRIHHKLIPTPVLGQLYHFRSWNPKSDSNTPSRTNPMMQRTFAEPDQKIHISKVENKKNWKYTTSASQNIQNFYKTPLERKVMMIWKKSDFFLTFIVQNRGDLRSDNEIYPFCLRQITIWG